MKRERGRGRGRTAMLAAATLALAVSGRAAHGYDPATTHAGLTEQSVLASRLHHVLIHRLARPLGLFEPIALRTGDLPAAEGNALEGRLATLDPSAGYRPGPDGVASALSWVVAGAVIAETPAERGQHLFYDPSRGAGLTDSGGLLPFGQGLRQLVDAGGGGVRAFATGTAFNMTGLPSTQWLAAPENDVGLASYYGALELAITGDEPARRATALARALLALGGTLAILEEAGEPAHVRNDFRGAYLGAGGAGPFDRGSLFERFVAETYGRMGVPAAGAPVDRPTVMSFITAADAQGLADRTQRRFFSAGSLPEDAVVDHDTSAAEVMLDARASLPYALPRLPRLELGAMGKRQYAYAAASDIGAAPARKSPTEKPTARRLLAYERVPGRVRFFLDKAVYGDSARSLLPEIGAYGAGLIDHLFRAELHLEVQPGATDASAGGSATVSVIDARGPVRNGQVRVYAEDASGRRRPLATVAAGESPVSVAFPAGTRRLAAVLRAEDAAGELVAVGEAAVH